MHMSKWFIQNHLPELSRCWVHIGNVRLTLERFLCLWPVMILLFLFCFVKSRIVRILFFCTLSQAGNFCPTTFYRNLQCLSLLISVSGVLTWTLYDWTMLRLGFAFFLLWCLSLFLQIYWCIFIMFLIIYWSVLVYECIRFYLTVSESDVINLFDINQIYIVKKTKKKNKDTSLCPVETKVSYI